MNQTLSPDALLRRHRAAVSSAFFANGLMVGSWVPEIPVFAARHDLSSAELGMMILAFGIGAIAAMPVVGAIIGRKGSRPPMLALHLALAAALPFLLLVPSLSPAVVAIIFAGIATGGMDVAMNANAVSLERAVGRAIMSSCHGFWSLGGLFGAGIGGFLIEGFGTTVHVLIVAAVILALWPLVWSHALTDRPAAGTTALEVEASKEANTAAGYLKAVAIGLFALCAMIPEGVAIDWSAIYLRQDLGAGAAASGLAFAAFSLTMAVLRFAGDGIRNRLGAVTTARVCSLAALVGLLLVAFAGNAGMAIAGFAVMGIGISNMVPIAFSAAGNVSGLRPGAGLSTVSVLGYSGILVAPSAIGFFAEHIGFSAVFASIAGLLVVTFLCAGLVRAADERQSHAG